MKKLVPMRGSERLEELKKKYRVLYWLGSMKTEVIVRAKDEEEAVKRFIELKGNKNIIKIEKYYDTTDSDKN